MGLMVTLPERFRVLQPLGEGGMGVVYEVYDEERKRTVALKTIRDAQGDAVYRLKREFRALQGIEHPNLVRLYDLMAHEGAYFYTMELVDGVELGAWTGSRGSVSGLDTTVGHDAAATEDFDSLREVLDSLCRGLEALHGAGLLHRDLKPSNVMVEHTGRVVLLDFGLVADAHAAAQQTVAGAVAGTVAYMAPEQARGETELTSAVDRYALGVILFELLTGVHPFRGTPYLVLADKVSRDAPRVREFRADIPADLDELTAGLLSRDPLARPSLAAVRGVLVGGSTDRPVSVTATNATSTRSGPLLVGRGREQAHLLEALRGTSAGGACIALVRGRSGIGKSALLAAVAREAETRERALVLVGRCHEFETVPFKGLDGVIDSLSRHLKASSSEELGRLLPPDLGDLATIFPVLRRIAPIASAYARRSTAERTVQRIRAAGLACLREMLRRIAEGTPLLVLIDDVQWADEDTSRALVELLKDQHPPAMLLLLGSRPDDSTPVIAELFGASGGRAVIEAARVTVDLEPLDETATLALIRAELHAGARGDLQAMMHDDLVATLAREAHGNPFAACELARFVREEEGDFEAGVVGRSIDEIVVKRADGLDAAARELLDVIAVSGEPTEERILRRSAGLSADDRASTDTLRAKLWIRSLRSGSATLLDAVHDRVRESIASVLPAPRRAAIHGALALALEATESPAHDRLARHFAAAGEASLAHHHALVASEEARASLALRRSADLLGLAIELATDAQRAELMPRYAQALADAGLFERCAEAWDRAADLTTGTERHAHRRRAAEAWLYAGRIDHGLDLLERIAGKTGLRVAKNRYLALAQTVWQRILLRLRGFSTRPRALSDIPARELERLATLRAVTIAYTTLDQIRGAMIHARWLRAALDAGHIEDARLALAFEGGLAAVSSSPRGRDLALKALSVLPAATVGGATEFWPLVVTTLWAALNDGQASSSVLARRLDGMLEAEGATLSPTHHSLAHFAIGFGNLFSLRPSLHEPRVRFVERREEEAGPFAEIRHRFFESYCYLLQGRPEAGLERGGQSPWEGASGRPLMFQAGARLFEVWSHFYRGDTEQSLDSLHDARRLAYATWGVRSPMVQGLMLTRICCAALAARRPAEVIAHAKQFRGTRAPVHHSYRTHLEALAALAGSGDPVAKLRAMADHGQRYGIEQLEGTALWGLGMLLAGPEGAPDRARLLALIADTGLVDPDRYFWSLMPIGEPPPRRGTTVAIWADPAPGGSA